MKNRILLFFLTLFLTGSLIAQNGRIGQNESISSWNPSLSSNFNSVSEAGNIAKQIVNAVGIKPNFEIREAKVPNAAAVLYMGKRYILYNPDFIYRLTKVTGIRWAAISILAHEIGHHQRGHTLNGNANQLASELEADEFSGYVLRKMGATLAQAQAAMKVIGNTRATRTHPAVDTRLASIAKGWENAGANGNNNNRDIAKTSPLPRINYPAANTGSTVLTDRYILADVQFHSDPNTNYYITTQYNIVKVSEDRLYQVGKLARLNSQRYPYIMYDENNTRLYVSATGSIISRSGNKVGSIKDHKS